MAKLTDEEFYSMVTESVCEGGFSSIYDIVRMVDIDELRSHYDWFDEEDEEEDEEE